jgi:hypothetical protein
MHVNGLGTPVRAEVDVAQGRDTRIMDAGGIESGMLRKRPRLAPAWLLLIQRLG